MKLKVENINYKILGLIVSTFCCVGAMNTDVLAQARDPFAKPIVRPKFNPKAPTAKKPGPTAVQAPPIQQRIDGYKAQRMVSERPRPTPTSMSDRPLRAEAGSTRSSTDALLPLPLQT